MRNYILPACAISLVLSFVGGYYAGNRSTSDVQARHNHASRDHLYGTLAILTADPECRDWYITPAREDGHIAGGVYVCNRQRSRSEVAHLPRSAARAHLWEGVVLVDRAQGFEINTTGWGRHGVVSNDLVIFGDPDMVECIHRLLLQDRR